MEGNAGDGKLGGGHPFLCDLALGVCICVNSGGLATGQKSVDNSVQRSKFNFRAQTFLAPLASGVLGWATQQTGSQDGPLQLRGEVDRLPGGGLRGGHFGDGRGGGVDVADGGGPPERGHPIASRTPAGDTFGAELATFAHLGAVRTPGAGAKNQSL